MISTKARLSNRLNLNAGLQLLKGLLLQILFSLSICSWKMLRSFIWMLSWTYLEMFLISCFRHLDWGLSQKSLLHFLESFILFISGNFYCYWWTWIIVWQAKLHIESGDIQGIIDPSLCGEYDIQSMWKIAEKALTCVQPHGHMRPSISEVLKEIQDAILIEREVTAARGVSDEMSRNSVQSSFYLGSLDLGGTENCLALDESIARPTAR